MLILLQGSLIKWQPAYESPLKLLTAKQSLLMFYPVKQVLQPREVRAKSDILRYIRKRCPDNLLGLHIMTSWALPSGLEVGRTHGVFALFDVGFDR